MPEALIAAANGAGGWGYHNGRTSRIEPTCWALLALGGAGDTFDLAPHARFLTSCQRADGLLADPGIDLPNFAFNGLAAVTALQRPGALGDGARARLLAAIVRTKGLGFPPHPALRQDNALQGWPWTEETFSWVEPTSWCTLALKRAPRTSESQARIDEADRLLIDRATARGGWNYGNPHVFGKDMAPQVPATAMALLALQDRRDSPVVRRAFRALEETAGDERAGMALALAAICLRVWGAEASPIGAELSARFAATEFFGNLHVTAMALCALSDGPGNDDFFRV